jgi:transposase
VRGRGSTAWWPRRAASAAPAERSRKRDASDAELLARALRAGELSPVRVPDPADEAARDLVRAREDARADLMRARHRLSKLLLRHGLVYEPGRLPEERMKGLEPSTFCMASRRSSQLSYIRGSGQSSDRDGGVQAG